MASDQVRIDAERKYLATGIEYSDLSKIFGVHERTIRRWAAAGDWEARREEACRRMSTAVQDAALEGALSDIAHRAAERCRITAVLVARHEAMAADITKAFDLATLTTSWINLCAFERVLLEGAPPDPAAADTGDGVTYLVPKGPLWADQCKPATDE